MSNYNYSHLKSRHHINLWLKPIIHCVFQTRKSHDGRSAIGWQAAALAQPITRHAIFASQKRCGKSALAYLCFDMSMRSSMNLSPAGSSYHGSRWRKQTILDGNEWSFYELHPYRVDNPAIIQAHYPPRFSDAEIAWRTTSQ